MNDDVDDAGGGHDAWLAESRALLAAARGNPRRVGEAVREIARAGFRDLELSPAIVWDYLTVSSPGLFGEAGYSDAEVDALTPEIERAMAEASRRPAEE
jgi:hypothetical protein